MLRSAKTRKSPRNLKLVNHSKPLGKPDGAHMNDDYDAVDMIDQCHATRAMHDQHGPVVPRSVKRPFLDIAVSPSCASLLKPHAYCGVRAETDATKNRCAQVLTSRNCTNGLNYHLMKWSICTLPSCMRRLGASLARAGCFGTPSSLSLKSALSDHHSFRPAVVHMDSAHALAVVCRAKQISREQGVVAQDELLGYLCQCAEINGSWRNLIRPVHGAAEATEQAVANSTLLARRPVPHATTTVCIGAHSSSYRALQLQLHLIPKMRPVEHRKMQWIAVSRWTMFTWLRFVTCAVPSSGICKTVYLSLVRECNKRLITAQCTGDREACPQHCKQFCRGQYASPAGNCPNENGEILSQRVSICGGRTAAIHRPSGCQGAGAIGG